MFRRLSPRRPLQILPRCFKCRELGHHAAACPQWGGGPFRRVLVWRRIALEPMSGDALGQPVREAPLGIVAAHTASDVHHADDGGADLSNSTNRGRRRIRPCRKRRLAEDSTQASHDGGPEGNGRDASSVPPVLDDGVSLAQGPPCVIDWSDKVARAEANLRTAVLITVVESGTGPAIDDLEVVKATVASSFNLVTRWCYSALTSLASTFCSPSTEPGCLRLVHARPTPRPR